MYIYVCKYVFSATMSIELCFIANGSLAGDRFCLSISQGRVGTRRRRKLEEKEREMGGG